MPLSSLRAKRGNPEATAAQSGLPRRSAPRNDESFRAFAAKFILSACKAVEGREINFLFSSREDAKARRIWEATE